MGGHSIILSSQSLPSGRVEPARWTFLAAGRAPGAARRPLHRHLGISSFGLQSATSHLDPSSREGAAALNVPSSLVLFRLRDLWAALTAQSTLSLVVVGNAWGGRRARLRGDTAGRMFPGWPSRTSDGGGGKRRRRCKGPSGSGFSRSMLVAETPFCSCRSGYNLLLVPAPAAPASPAVPACRSCQPLPLGLL